MTDRARSVTDVEKVDWKERGDAGGVKGRVSN